MSATRPSRERRCVVCGLRVDRCDFCERGDCQATICSRCLRTAILQHRNHPPVAAIRVGRR